MPLLIIVLTQRFKLAAKIGGIIIAYAIGLLIGHSGLFPAGSEAFHNIINNGFSEITADKLNDMYSHGLISDDDIKLFKIRQLQDNIMSFAVLMAIPLLLFSCNAKSWFRMAGKTFMALLTGIIAVLIMIILGFVLFRNSIPDAWKVAGMLVGVYTGGTPNLAALKIMLDVNPDLYIMTHTYDTILSAFFIFILISVGKQVFGSFLPAYPFKNGVYEKFSVHPEGNYTGIFKHKVFLQLLFAIGVALLVVIFSVLISIIVTHKMNTVIIILSLTTLGILTSLIPRINRIEKTFEAGMYFILIFGIVVASMANFRQLVHISGSLFYYITLAVIGSLFLHAFLSWLLKVDADTLIIAHTALICSPPFVPMVAGALRNREVVIAGLTIGIIGYAVGNYLGYMLAIILRNF
jgi:uncharacterized membrane protein